MPPPTTNIPTDTQAQLPPGAKRFEIKFKMEGEEPEQVAEVVHVDAIGAMLLFGVQVIYSGLKAPVMSITIREKEQGRILLPNFGRRG